MIKYKIDMTKIDNAHLYEGQKGTYLSGVFFENRDGKSQYGDDGFIVQDVSKEAREAGQKGPIIGNWRRIETKKAAAPPRRPAPSERQDVDEDIPF
jgi:hypothetical protein